MHTMYPSRYHYHYSKKAKYAKRLLFFLCFFAPSTVFFAEEEISPPKQKDNQFNSLVMFTTDYVSRGISDTFRHPALQGEFDYKHTSGLYLKMWGSNIDTRIINGSNLEIDLYVGFEHFFSCFPKFKYDIGLLFYYYPGGKALVPAQTSYNTIEYYIAYGYEKFNIQLSLTATDFFGNNSSNPPMNWNKKKLTRPNGHSYGSPYLEINHAFNLYKEWNITLHLGYQGVIHYPELSYLDWQISVLRPLLWFDVALSYSQSTAKKAFYALPNNVAHPNKRTNLGGATVTVSLSKSF